MTKKEIREEIDNLDYDVVAAIIACCKELCCAGVPLFNWDIETVLKRFDEATADWED